MTNTFAMISDLEDARLEQTVPDDQHANQTNTAADAVADCCAETMLDKSSEIKSLVILLLLLLLLLLCRNCELIELIHAKIGRRV